MGEGVRIAIVDDGIQTTHPDLKDNVRVDSSWNYNGDKQSPDPTYLKGPAGVCHLPSFWFLEFTLIFLGLARNSICWRRRSS